MTSYEHIPNCKMLIGLTGLARHGKDTAAKMLLRILPGSERFAFSDAISAVARGTVGMTERNPRLLQKVGMDMRDLRPFVWRDALYYHMKDREPEIAIVTGLRFPDEVNMVRACSATSHIVRIVRTNEDGTLFRTNDRDTSHRVESKISTLPQDVTITAKDLQELHFHIKTFAHVKCLVEDLK